MTQATLKLIKTWQYLDKGFVELLNVNMNEVDAALLARASFNKEEYDRVDDNLNLVDYLVRHHHTSPMEMPSFTVRLKIPIFVQRQNVRHRTARLNEQSLRYVTHDGDFHIPDVIRRKDKNVKQGSSSEAIEANDELKKLWEDHYKASYELYEKSLAMGAAPEQARSLLGVGFYTTLVWQMDISNILKYMRLRSDPHAQLEIRLLSNIFEEIVKEYFPTIYSAWVNHQRDSLTLSSDEIDILREVLSGNKTQNEAYLSRVEDRAKESLRSTRVKELLGKMERIYRTDGI